MSVRDIQFRTPYNYDCKAVSNVSVVFPSGYPPSLTIQSQAADADINVMMKRFGVTGHFPQNPRVPSYGDFSGINDYRTAIEAVRAADVAFLEFPAELRARFGNDPQQLLLFVSNPANLEEARKLGLAKKVVSNGISGQSVGSVGQDVGGAGGSAAGGAVVHASPVGAGSGVQQTVGRPAVGSPQGS